MTSTRLNAPASQISAPARRYPAENRAGYRYRRPACVRKRGQARVSVSINAQVLPSRAAAITCSVRVVLPEHSARVPRRYAPIGRPPVPSARCPVKEPVEIVSTSIERILPRRMMEPLPNCFFNLAQCCRQRFLFVFVDSHYYSCHATWY